MEYSNVQQAKAAINKFDGAMTKGSFRFFLFVNSLSIDTHRSLQVKLFRSGSPFLGSHHLVSAVVQVPDVVPDVVPLLLKIYSLGFKALPVLKPLLLLLMIGM